MSCRALGVVAVLAFAAAVRAADAPEAFGSVGYLKAYLDEPGQVAAGGGLRIPLAGRLSVRPEYLISSDSTYAHQFFLGNMTYDLMADRGKRVVPYAIGGVGLVNTREKTISYSSRNGLALGGFGFRLNIGDLITISTEIRAGNKAFPLATIHIGIRLSRSR
jgi:hypothetical protein